MKLNKKYSFIIGAIGAILAMVLLNLLLLAVESRAENAIIKTFFSAFWYMIVTLTTVGYGDVYPVTPAGKVIGFIFIFGSLGILGYLISTLTNKYQSLMEEKKLGFRGTDFENHVIFIGWNEFSKMVAEEIYHTSKKMAIITRDKNEIDLIYAHFGKKNTFVLFGDYQNIESLEKLNVSKAAAVFINIPDDAQVLLYIIDFKKHFPEPHIIVSIENSKLKNTFMTAGVTYAVARNEIASKMVASYMFEPDVANLSYDLISTSRGHADHDMFEFEIKSNNPFAEKRFLELFVDMKKKYNAIAIGISRQINGSWQLIANPPEDEPVQAGDFLIVMCDGLSKKQIIDHLGIEEGRIIH